MSKKILKGKVVSTKMQKTVVVSVEVPKKHPIYGKTLRNTMRFKAHDTLGVKVGQIVNIVESRPVGGKVTWQVAEIK